MKKLKYSILFVMVLLVQQGLMAMPVEIKGYITNDFGTPLINYPVNIHTGNNGFIAELFTDSIGYFEYDYNSMPGNDNSILVTTWSMCMGNFTPYYEEIAPMSGTVWVNFQICSPMPMPSLCIADFFPAKHSGSSNVQFYNTSHGNNFENEWDFGDGQSSNQFEPMHHYDQIGVYLVTLHISGSNNCSDDYNQLVYVGEWNGVFTNVLGNTGNLSETNGYVFQVNPFTQEISIALFTSTQSNLYLTLSLFYDNYILVEPIIDYTGYYFPHYFPTYYGDVLQWQDATSYNLFNQPFQIDVDLKSYDQPVFGNGKIQGTVIRNDDYIPQFKGLEDNGISSSVISGDSIRIPLNLFLVNDNNEVISYVPKNYFTGDDGYFSFDDIPYGNYKIRTEMFGRQALEFPVSVDETQAVSDFYFIDIQNNNILLGTETPVNQGDIKLFPNPCVDHFQILDLDAGEKKITISNMQGHILLEEKLIDRDVEISCDSYAAGIYLVSVTTSQKQYISTLLIK